MSDRPEPDELPPADEDAGLPTAAQPGAIAAGSPTAGSGRARPVIRCQRTGRGRVTGRSQSEHRR